MDYEKKDFRKLYEDLVKSDWFKRAYHNKSLGECPFDIPELNESEDERIRKFLVKHVSEWIEDIEYDLKFSSKDVESEEELAKFKAGVAYLEKQKEYELTEEDKKIIPEALVMLCDDIINHRVHTPIKTDEEGARKIKAFLKTFNRQPHKTKEEWEEQKEPQHAIRVTKGFGDPDGPQVELIDLQKEQNPAEYGDEFITEAEEYASKINCGEYKVEVTEAYIAGALRANNKPAEWDQDDEQYLLICKNALRKYQQSNQWDANIISDWLEKRLKSSYQPKPE